MDDKRAYVASRDHGAHVAPRSNMNRVDKRNNVSYKAMWKNLTDASEGHRARQTYGKTMNQKSAAQTLLSLKKAELRSIVELTAAIERARASGDWLEEEVFVEILTVGMRLVGLSASDLAREEGVSRSAVSKWLHNAAIPSVPTRKTVILWLEEKLRSEKRSLDEAISAPTPVVRDQVLEETG